MTSIDLGIFAHNESGRIGPMLESLLGQNILTDPTLSVMIHVLANGCKDATVAEARAVVADKAAADHVQIHDLTKGGKSRTWNRFVHDLSRPAATFLVFLDADITIPDANVLRGLVSFVRERADLAGASSKAVKDISYDPSLVSSWMDKLISAAGGTLHDWKGSICGQLYVLRAEDARSFHMPIGLPVEDGFVRAMIQTHNFTTEGQPETRLDGRDDLFHVYASERGIGALIRHQTRIVIGSAINSVVYGKIRHATSQERSRILAQGAEDDAWLPQLLRQNLPRSYGYVPTDFLTKRIRFWWRSADRMNPKRIAVMIAGFGFDAVVYVKAQLAMWRGVGAGFW